ncbi:DoxX family membrane protein [Oceanicola sp. S124]|uniref:DoxX family membrane protein n=1 Tax=Oceanicola sp. S124 TaxID=1042378 RepID=UPI0002557E07|nr:DoxX family membrane protein [Oceanicola sp. S124]
MTDPTAPLARVLDHLAPLLPLLARFIFAAVLLPYFWASAVTKLGDGVLGVLRPSVGAYAQIFPRVFEAAGYDTSKLGAVHWAVVTAGTWAEFALPALLVLGLLTRLAALGMVGFIAVQSLTDLYGHGGIDHPATLGAWFDRMPDGVILDQRAFWVFTLLVLAVKGAGALSLDRLVFRSGAPARPGGLRPAPEGPRSR